MSAHAETIEALARLARFAEDAGGCVHVSHVTYPEAPTHLAHVMGPELRRQFVVSFATRVPCFAQAPELGAAIASCADAVRKAWTCPQCDKQLAASREHCEHCDWRRPR